MEDPKMSSPRKGLGNYDGRSEANDDLFATWSKYEAHAAARPSARK